MAGKGKIMKKKNRISQNKKEVNFFFFFGGGGTKGRNHDQHGSSFLYLTCTGPSTNVLSRQVCGQQKTTQTASRLRSLISCFCSSIYQSFYGDWRGTKQTGPCLIPSQELGILDWIVFVSTYSNRDYGLGFKGIQVHYLF